MREYETLLENRLDPIENHSPWMWIASDQGAWSGPKGDWVNQHAQFIFPHIKKFTLCIQAGGNCGMYPRLLSTRFSYVYTFEPDSLNFHCLVNNCQVPNIMKLNMALGNEVGFIEMYRPDMHNVGTHKIDEINKGMIPMTTIDTFNFPTCDLIMLDVEQYELNVLQGAINTIEKFKPVITAENGNRPEIVELLSGLGYEEVGTTGADHIYAVK